MANTEEAEARRAMMLRSSWSAAAPDAKHEYMPISSNELNRQYTHCKSAAASERFVDFTRPAKPAMNPAGEFVASKRYGMGAEDAASTTHSALGSGLVLGYDARETRKSSEMYGEGLRKVSTPVNLLESVPPVRDATLDGAHRASMTETHMPDIWDPYASEFKKGAASFASATMLRDASRRRKRPLLPPLPARPHAARALTIPGDGAGIRARRTIRSSGTACRRRSSRSLVGGSSTNTTRRASSHGVAMAARGLNVGATRAGGLTGRPASCAGVREVLRRRRLARTHRLPHHQVLRASPSRRAPPPLRTDGQAQALLLVPLPSRASIYGSRALINPSLPSHMTTRRAHRPPS